MVERGAHQPGGVDLRDPAVAGAGEPRVSFDPADRGDHGFVMSVFDLRPNLGTAKRPQQRHRLHRGEDQVIARDRASLTSGLPPSDPLVLNSARRATMLVFERPRRLRDPLGPRGQRLVCRVTGPQPGCRLAASGGQHCVTVGVRTSPNTPAKTPSQ
jgi:hypothetical protein